MHYDIVQCCDYVNGVLSSERVQELETHLSRCPKCQESVELLRSVREMAKRESGYSVPNFAVQQARAIFPLWEPMAVEVFPHVPAELVYDSFLDPLPVGTRSQTHVSRQVLYVMNDLQLHLQMDRAFRGQTIVMTGQLSDRKNAGRQLEGVPITLLTGKRVVSRTLSNQFGEFSMEFQPDPKLKLQVHFMNDGTVDQVEVKVTPPESESSEP